MTTSHLSDGVYREIAGDEIYDIMCDAESDLQQACDTLVELANIRGGRDDSTIVALRYGSDTVL